MSQASTIKPIALNTPSVFAALKQRDEAEKQQLISEQEEKAVYLRHTLKNHIPAFIDLINKAFQANKGELGSNSDNGKYAEYRLQLGALEKERISKVGLLCILGKVYAEFKNAGWKKFSISFSASEMDHTYERDMYGNALNVFTVEVRVFETFDPHDGVHVTDYGCRDRTHRSRDLLKRFYRLADIPEIDTLSYKQLYQH